MISKLCYLFTFIFSVTNLIGATNLSWELVFTPSIVVTVLNLILFGIACVLAYFASK